MQIDYLRVKGLFAPGDTQRVPIYIPGPLHQPTSEDEIRNTLSRLHNQCATEWTQLILAEDPK